ncbi:MAG: S-adenosylmethionine:tRNA ribosyltransferase-isomerase [Vicinamibacteria bacterium]
MSPARERRWRPQQLRLLRVDAARAVRDDATLAELPRLLSPGDLLVVNDAATLPASLRGHDESGAEIELRLLAEDEDGDWSAALLGAGDWRTRTENRPLPPSVVAGAALRFGKLRARVLELSPLSPRLLRLRFEARGDALWRALYRLGRPIQYSHLARDLELWEAQTAYAGRPWAVEAPSAGLGLTPGLILELRRAGVGVRSLTHAAGVSATGDPAIDAALPLPERFEIPESTASAVRAARAARGRVVAVGTSVVRALETAAADGGGLSATAGISRLRIGPAHRLRAVDGLLTGVHEPGTSHHELLQAFLPRPALDAALAQAEASGYLGHEFGDLLLLLPERDARAPVRAA